MWLYVVALLALAAGLAFWIILEYYSAKKKRDQLVEEAARDIARLAVARAGSGTNDQSADSLEYGNCGAAMVLTVGLNIKANAKQLEGLKHETYKDFLKELTDDERSEWPVETPDDFEEDVDPEESWMRHLSEKGRGLMHFHAVKRARYVLLNWEVIRTEFTAKSRLRGLNLVSEKQYEEVVQMYRLTEEELLRLQYESLCLHGDGQAVFDHAIFFIQDQRRKAAEASREAKAKQAAKKAVRTAELNAKQEAEKKEKVERQRQRALQQLLKQ